MTTTPDTPYPLLIEAGIKPISRELRESWDNDPLAELRCYREVWLPAIESHLASVIAERDKALTLLGAAGNANTELQYELTQKDQELEEAREARRQSVEAWNYAQTQNQQMREALGEAMDLLDRSASYDPGDEERYSRLALRVAALNPSPSTEGGTE